MNKGWAVWWLFVLGFPVLAHANPLDFRFVRQTPGNVVSQATPIEYEISTQNIGSSNMLGVSIRMLVNNATIPADSGRISASGCIVDRQFPNFFACQNLSLNEIQAIRVTWPDPDPGTLNIEFEAVCQELVTGGTNIPCPRRYRVGTTTVVAAPLLSLSSASYSVNENARSATVSVLRTGLSTGAASVRYSVSNITATAGADYTAVSGTLNWADGDTSAKNFTIPILDDNLLEGNETLRVFLFSPGTGSALGSPNSATLTIVDVETGELQLSASQYSVDENGGNLAVQLTRSNGTQGAASIGLVTRASGATAGADYTHVSTTVSWADGDGASKTVNIPILDDNLVEGAENFFIDLGQASGARRGANVTAEAVINDVENGEINFQAAAVTVNENAGSVTLQVTRGNGSQGAVSVQYATANGSAVGGSDYTATSGTLNWADGDTAAKTITIPILDDIQVEGDESFSVTLTQFGGGARIGTAATSMVTINDVENGALEFQNTPIRVDENGGFITANVARSGGSHGAVSVQFNTANAGATAGADYTAMSGSLTWADGDTALKTLRVPILDDNLVEGPEDFRITLSQPGGGARIGAAATATVTIDDVENGEINFQSANATVNESAGSITINVTRRNGSLGAVSVQYATADGSATAGSDYTATSGTLNWADGDATIRTIVVPILDDTLPEGGESFSIALSRAGGGARLGATATSTISINDVENGELNFEVANVSVNENTPSITVNLVRAGGSQGAVSVQYATANGTATAGSDYTATSGSLNWADGDGTVKSITVPILDDNLAEGVEDFQVRLSQPSGGARIGLVANLAVSIQDVEEGVIQFSRDVSTVQEDGGSIQLTVSRSGGSNGTAGVQYTTSNGTATAGSDFTAASGSLQWADGDSADKVITIEITNDNSAESNEDFRVMLSNASGAVLGSPAEAQVVIVESGTAGIIQLQQATYDTDEDAGSVMVQLTRTAGVKGAVSVTLVTGNGSAIAGVDYTAVNTSVNWSDGDGAVKSVSIPILTDSLQEQLEDFSVALSNPAGGAVIGNIVQGTVRIADKTVVENPGGAGILAFSNGSISVDETAGIVEVEVSRTQGNLGAVSVTVAPVSGGSATAGSDFTFENHTLNWLDGETGGKTVRLRIHNDDELEGVQTIRLALRAPTGGAELGVVQSAVISVQDDELTSGPVSNIGAISGQTVIRRFTVSSSGGAITLSAGNGTVEPASIAGTAGASTRGEVSYRFVIPAGSTIGSTFTDNISITSVDGQVDVPVTITVRQALSLSQDLNTTQLSVAQVFDGICADTPSNALASKCDQIFALDEASKTAALRQIAPQQLASQANTSMEIATTQIGNIQNRLVAMRAGAGGLGSAFSLRGLQMQYDRYSIPLGVLIHSAAGDNKPLFKSPLGMFVSGRFELGGKNSTNGEVGYDFRTNGLTYGMDYRYSKRMFFGGALGFSDTSADFSQASGDLGNNAFSFSAYGSYYGQQSYFVDWVAGNSRSDFAIRRKIAYPGAILKTDGHTKGSQNFLSVSSGYELKRRRWLLTANLNMDYVNVLVDGYREGGGGGLALRIDGQRTDSLTTGLGIKVSNTVSSRWGVLKPSAQMSWLHEYRDESNRITARFAEDPRLSFVVITDEPDRDYFNVNLSMVMVLVNGRTAFFNYKTLLGRDQLRSDSFDLGFRMEF